MGSPWPYSVLGAPVGKLAAVLSLEPVSLKTHLPSWPTSALNQGPSGHQGLRGAPGFPRTWQFQEEQELMVLHRGLKDLHLRSKVPT